MVTSEAKISEGVGGLDTIGSLAINMRWGRGLGRFSGLPQAGGVGVVCGPHEDNTSASNAGAAWLFYVTPQKSVLPDRGTKLDGSTPLLNGLDVDDRFGYSFADLPESATALGAPSFLAVGAPGKNSFGVGAGIGEVWLLSLSEDGSQPPEIQVDSATKFKPSGLGAADTDRFGVSLANLGDPDGTETADTLLAVGADLAGPQAAGRVWFAKIAGGTYSSPAKSWTAPGAEAGDNLGFSLAVIQPYESGSAILAIGAPGTNNDRGSVWIVEVDAGGNATDVKEIYDAVGSPLEGLLEDGDRFGSSLTTVTNAQGVTRLVVGSARDQHEGSPRGSVWLLALDGSYAVTNAILIDNDSGGFNGPLDDGDGFGSSVLGIDLDGGGDELLVGATGDDGAMNEDFGAVWVLGFGFTPVQPLGPAGSIRGVHSLATGERAIHITLAQPSWVRVTAHAPGDPAHRGPELLKLGWVWSEGDFSVTSPIPARRPSVDLEYRVWTRTTTGEVAASRPYLVPTDSNGGN